MSTNSTEHGSREPDSFSSETAKYVADFYKLITTLSTGSLVLLFSFVDKLFPEPKWKILVALTMLGFLSTVVCCIYSYWIHLSSVEFRRKLTKRQQRLDDFLGLGVMASFSGALACLVMFFLRNYLF